MADREKEYTSREIIKILDFGRRSPVHRWLICAWRGISRTRWQGWDEEDMAARLERLDKRPQPVDPEKLTSRRARERQGDQDQPSEGRTTRALEIILPAGIIPEEEGAGAIVALQPGIEDQDAGIIELTFKDTSPVTLGEPITLGKGQWSGNTILAKLPQKGGLLGITETVLTREKAQRLESEALSLHIADAGDASEASRVARLRSIYSARAASTLTGAGTEVSLIDAISELPEMERVERSLLNSIDSIFNHPDAELEVAGSQADVMIYISEAQDRGKEVSEKAEEKRQEPEPPTGKTPGSTLRTEAVGTAEFSFKEMLLHLREISGQRGVLHTPKRSVILRNQIDQAWITALLAPVAALFFLTEFVLKAVWLTNQPSAGQLEEESLLLADALLLRNTHLLLKPRVTEVRESLVRVVRRKGKLEWDDFLVAVNSHPGCRHRFVDESVSSHKVVPLPLLVADESTIFYSQLEIPLRRDYRDTFNRLILRDKFKMGEVLLRYAAKLWATELEVTQEHYQKQATEMSCRLDVEMIEQGIPLPPGGLSLQHPPVTSEQQLGQGAYRPDLPDPPVDDLLPPDDPIDIWTGELERVMREGEETYQQHKEAWDQLYAGQYIAIYQGKVVDSDRNESELEKRLIESQKKRGRYRTYIVEVGSPILEMRGPRKRLLAEEHEGEEKT